MEILKLTRLKLIHIIVKVAYLAIYLFSELSLISFHFVAYHMFYLNGIKHGQQN